MLHLGLTVGQICTERTDLMACSLDEEVAEVMVRNEPRYDYLPVLESGQNSSAQIIGLFTAQRQFRDESGNYGIVKDHYQGLSESILIGADATILDYLCSAVQTPCRLVVAGSKIVGIVNLLDIQKLPARAALFAVLTNFEMCLSSVIAKTFPDNAWMGQLTENRRAQISARIEEADTEIVTHLLFTQLSDKTTVISRSKLLGRSRNEWEQTFKPIRKLRDNLMHANDYASTPGEAAEVCEVIATVMALMTELKEIEHA